MAQPYTTFHFLDRSGEESSLKLHLPDVTPANYAAMLTGVNTDLHEAITELTLCAVGATPEIVCEVHADSAAIPADPYAQRERRAIFSFIDSVTTRKFIIGVPAPDLGDMSIPGTDAINLDNIDVDAYLTALASYALSPEGNAFSVIRGRVEGRNI